MKALSVRQPYAGLIVRGEKTIEMRSWRTDYRGPILICAGRTSEVTFDDPEEQARFDKEFPRNIALGIADLVSIHKYTTRDAEGTGERYVCGLLGEAFEPAALDYDGFAWVLADARPIEPFPVRGRPGLFDVVMPYEGR